MAGVHVEAGEQRERAVADVLVPDPDGLAGRGGQSLVNAPRAWVEGLAPDDRMRSAGRGGSPP